MKNILMTIGVCETITIASSIVGKTLELASAFSSKVWIIHIAPPSHQSPYNVDNKMFRNDVASEFRHEHDYLQHLAKCMRNKNVDVTALLVQGSAINTILKESERLVIDLVVLGCHEYSQLFSALMKDTDESLLAEWSLPIMFVPT